MLCPSGRVGSNPTRRTTRPSSSCAPTGPGAKVTGMRRTVGMLALVLAGGLLAPAAPAAGAPSQPHHRISGDDRYATSAAISAEVADPGVEVAYVATGLDFADALAAGAHGEPVLLVTRDDVPAPVAAELDRLDPQAIVVLGDTDAVSRSVEEEVAQHTDGEVTRVAGPDRYATAADLSRRLHPDGAGTAFVVSGGSAADAVAAGAAAVGSGPVLLVSRDSVPATTSAELERLQPDTVVVVGGTAVVSAAVEQELRASTGAAVSRWWGADRYATAAAVSAGAFGPPTGDVYLADGASFADAIAGAWAAGSHDSPVLLVERACAPAPVIDEIDRLGAERVVLLGGAGVLSDGAGRLQRCGVTTTTTIATGLQVPWDVAFAPGGVAYLTERDSGRVLRRAADGAVTEVHRFVVDPSGEGGLLGLAASPTFARDGLLFAYMTTATDNRVVRFRAGSPTSATAILTGIPKASIHDAGRVAFGPDGHLYVTTGDAGQPSRSQDLGSLAGKVLRIRPDGGPAPGNPFGSSPVYALGLRDPQGIAWRADGLGYVTEFGPDRDDEINVLRAGANYGWPEVTGVAGRSGFDDPVVVRQPPVASWSGAAVVHGGVREWDGDLVVACLRGQRLYRFDLAADGSVVGSGEELHTGTYGRLRHVEQAPDGSLWVLTSNRDGRGTPVADDDRIIRIGPPA